MATTLQAQKVRIPVVGFGDRLRRFRLSLGMDQREFADALGGAFSHATLSRYESMEGTPRAAVLVANSVELRFGLPASWLLTGLQPTGLRPDRERRRMRRFRHHHRTAPPLPILPDGLIPSPRASLDDYLPSAAAA